MTNNGMFEYFLNSSCCGKTVTLAKAGVQWSETAVSFNILDSRLRGNDK